MYTFANLTKQLGIILVHSHWMAIVLAVVMFLFDNLREKRSVLLSEQSGIANFKNYCGTPLENCYLRERKIKRTTEMCCSTYLTHPEAIS